MKKISQKNLPKIIVILGPTASGKSDLAVELAKKYNGEIISADSRQIYKGLNIGTGKITKKEMQGIPHHLLDVASPQSKKKFTVQNYKILAEKAISQILEKNKLPIICGGTGFYIQAVVDNISFPEVPPDFKLREKLSRKTSQELFSILKKLDPKRAQTIDKNNYVRLIRAIEIAEALGKVPEIISKPMYNTLQIGIQTDDKILRQKIHTRLLQRIKKGMIQEIKNLHKKGLSWKRMHELGLEYRYLALYLKKAKPFDGAQSKQKMLKKLETEIWHYAKRQQTWFKRDSRIKWFKVSELRKIEREIARFKK